MRLTFQHIKKAGLYFTALLLAAGYPFIAIAQTPPDAAVTEPVVVEEQTVVEPEPEPQLTYSYDPTTQTWSSEKYQFNPNTGTYEAVPEPVVVEVPEETITDETAIDVNTEVDVTNNLNSEATTGDAAVASNTTGGSATSGDAAVSATMLNSINSVIASGENQEVAQFTQDIYGDVYGDIMLYPTLLKTLLESEIKDSLDINATTDLQLTNNLDLTATSGDATVTSNTNAGNATTGDATAIVNLINILNSMIATQQSFVGTINIYGNLEGDILLAPDFIPQMIANNGGYDSSSTQVSTQDTTTILNNINAMAESGAAAVIDNTTAGSATSGSADTNVVIFNMTGHDIVAANSLLVFVNVLGQWVGVIVDAPSGATAAMIGNGVESHLVAPELTINADTTHGITNNINVTAQTGDAEVSKNTNAGNATSGNANAMVNVANVAGSQLSLTGWFGVLFINVFQNWFGSFGVDTAYGNTPKAVGGSGGASPGVMEFVPKSEKQVSTTSPLTLVDSRWVAESVTEEEVDMAVTPAAASTGGKGTPEVAGVMIQPETIAQDYRLWIIAGSLVIVGLSAVGLRRLFASPKEAGIATLE